MPPKKEGAITQTHNRHCVDRTQRVVIFRKIDKASGDLRNFRNFHTFLLSLRRAQPGLQGGAKKPGNCADSAEF
jgi:hypothetical protein